MDPVFLAMSLCRRRKFEQCVEMCTEILAKNPYDQVYVALFALFVYSIVSPYSIYRYILTGS